MKSKNKKCDHLDILRTIYVIGTVVVLLIYSFLVTYSKANLFAYEKAIMVLLIIGFIVYIISKIKNHKFSIYEFLIFGLVFFSLISTIFAVNRNSALWGIINRREGLIAYLAYYITALISLNIKSSKAKKIIIFSIIGVGIVNLVYGLLQTEVIVIKGINVPASWHYAKGLNGNSMFFSSLMSLCFPIMAGLFIKEEKISLTIIYGILMCLFAFGVQIGGAMALLLAVICLLIFMLVKQLINIYHNPSKKQIVMLVKIFITIIVVLVTTAIWNNRNSTYSWELKQFASQTAQVTQGIIDDSFGTRRIFIWKESLKKLKEYPITGIGIDNYRDAYKPLLKDYKTGDIITKAHNDYLQKMVCEGVISGLYYLFFIIFIFFKKIKEDEYIYYPLLLAYTCYSIQIFFSISVTRVTPLYYIVIGLLLSKEVVIEKKQSKK